MPDLLALEWDHGQVCGVLATVSPGRVQARRAFVLAKPQIAASASGSGPIPVEWLKSELTRLGITGGQVLVALPRDESVVRRLEVPPTPDAELPVIVRFQAGVKSQTLLDESSLDFIPLPSHGDAPGREVLMATVSKQTLTEIRTITELAGLELATVSLTPAAVAELVARVETAQDSDGESLVVARHGTRIEITVLRNQHLLFSHSARLSDEAISLGPQAMSSETSRALVSLRAAVPHVRIARVWTLVGESEHEPLAELLRRRLGCEVKRLDPLKDVTCDSGAFDSQHDTALFAGPLGMLWSRAEPRVPALDFLSPRKPPVVRDTRKRKLAIAGGTIAALLVLAGIVEAFLISRLSSRIDELQFEDSKLGTILKTGQPVLKSAESIRQWNAASVLWLNEFAEIAERLPPTDRAYVEDVTFEPKSSGAAVPQARIKGFARKREDIMGLSERFLTPDDRYRVLPHSDLSPTTTDGYYPWRYTSQIQLVEPTKKRGAANSPPAQGAKATAPVNTKSPATSTASPATPPAPPSPAARISLPASREGAPS